MHTEKKTANDFCFFINKDRRASMNIISQTSGGFHCKIIQKNTFLLLHINNDKQADEAPAPYKFLFRVLLSLHQKYRKVHFSFKHKADTRKTLYSCCSALILYIQYSNCRKCNIF